MTDLTRYWVFTIFEKTYHFSPYLVLNGIGLICGLLLLDKRLENTFPKDSRKIYIIFVLSIVAGWLGAHLLDVFAKNQIVGHAGFTFFGGLIFGTVFFIVLFVKYFNTDNLITALNIGVIPLILGHAIGRIGCYFSGCCYGKLIEYSTYLSSIFIRHPTQIYESIFLFMLFTFLTLKENMKIHISNVYIYLASYGTFRFFIEFLRGDYRGQFLYGLSPSQWISFSVILGLFMFLSVKSVKNHVTKNK
jgi:phosphatidylglycerol---prolipoprotein diacylglyceryl transferase